MVGQLSFLMEVPSVLTNQTSAQYALFLKCLKARLSRRSVLVDRTPWARGSRDLRFHLEIVLSDYLNNWLQEPAIPLERAFVLGSQRGRYRFLGGQADKFQSTNKDTHGQGRSWIDG